jgi:hypothetical protein
VQSQTSVRFSWEANPEPVGGYKIYIGDETRTYTRIVDVGKPETGNDGRVEASVMLEGGDKFYACTAYNSEEESDYSDEVNYKWMPIPRVIYDIN